MRPRERRLRALESAAGIDAPKPWRRVIVGNSESKAEVFESEGIDPEDNVILRLIVEPGGEIAASGLRV